ncbi:serpin family protein [Nocardioides bizhenqiangii]|uniref:Serpin family protein n=1 Tax=Nocardioides bizhenqiangii TaxID=3095076 RepID=A0ABZ0ZTL1_9ACTN|nr:MULTISPECIES: serpin family protein [unclassified Nocardioides]MDZ5621677.1 serpin family protein [Nocardioides sp. HM23]WQQ27637.1 serpin family protein [Nocardioides sp. HM61]
MITRRDTIRLAALAALVQPLLSACGGGSSDDGRHAGPPVGDGGPLELVRSYVDRVPGDARSIPDVVAAMHRFAGGVYGALPSDGNLVLSPYSIAVALGMTLNGAGGTTAEEMRQVLGADDRFHAGLNALTAHVEGLAGRQRRADGSEAEVALDTANQLFGQQGVGWEEGFLDPLAKQYGAGIRIVDFENAFEEARILINDWVEQQTHDRIVDLIPDGVLNDLTRLVLVNAVYLKAPWEKPFEKELTALGQFHLADGSTVDVDLMSGPEVDGQLASGDGWRAARLSYAGSRLAMTVVLPDDGRLADVEGLIAAGALPDVLAGGRKAKLDLLLPRWTNRTSAPLGEILKELGMPTAFDPDAADFRPMTSEHLQLFIAAVLHQGFIAVDEDGTEAAAATAVVAQLESMPVTTPFHVDRPFLYVIHDVEHGTPLFLGRVVDPTEEG